MRPIHRHSLPISSLLMAATAFGCSSAARDRPTSPPAVEQATPAEHPPAVDEPHAPPQAPAFRLPDTVRPEEYRVELTIDPAVDAFTGVVDIDVSLLERADHIWLQAADLDIRAATLKAHGQTFPLDNLPTSRDDFVGFSPGVSLPVGKATLHLEYTGHMPEKQYEGFLRRQQDDAWYVYTHFEPLGARRAFPCFDEPRFKVPWQLTIHTRDGHQAFTNTPLVEEKAGPGEGMKTFRFARSKPLPSYLVALAVGPFETVEIGNIGRANTPARIIVPRGHTKEARYAVEATPRLLSALEDYFDSPYPYKKLDSIAVIDFRGAMENPGLITYSQGLILTDPGKETRRSRRVYTSVSAHELAHQWFGDLVTMDWWNDIWLNESFATWMETKIVTQVEPKWDNEVRRVGELDHAVAADSSALASRIHRDIATPGDIESAFDAISYDKGGAVLGMFERWVGEDVFRDGVRQYLKQHAWGTATSDDFLNAIGHVSGKQVSTAFATFLQQPGVPLISVSLGCESGKSPLLSMSQERMLPTGSRASSDRTWQIPVCVKYGKGQKVEQSCTLMTQKTANLALDGLGVCPDWVQANAGGAGYYRVAYADGLLSRLLKQGNKHASDAERVVVASDMSALVQTGKISLDESLAQVPILLRSKDPQVIRLAATVVSQVSADVVPDELRPNFRRYVNRFFRRRARKLGWEPKEGETEGTHKLRRALLALVVRRGEDPVLIKQAIAKARTWLDTRTGIDSELLELVMFTAGKHADQKLYKRLVDAMESTEDRQEKRALVYAVASTSDEHRIVENLRLAISGKLGMRAAAPMVFIPLGDPATRPFVYEHIKQNYDQVMKELPRMAHRFIIAMPGAFCDQQHYNDVKQFFTPRAAKITGGHKVLVKTLERIELCMAFRAEQGPSIEAFLKKY